MSSARVRRRADVLWRRSLDTVVLLAPDGDAPVTLAGTGPDVWDLLAGPVSVADLVQQLAARYGADEAVVRADVAGLLERLSALGVVEPVP